MTIILTPGHLIFLGSAIVFATTGLFHCAYYIGKFMGRLEEHGREIRDLRRDVTELRAGA